MFRNGTIWVLIAAAAIHTPFWRVLLEWGFLVFIVWYGIRTIRRWRSRWNIAINNRNEMNATIEVQAKTISELRAQLTAIAQGGNVSVHIGDRNVTSFRPGIDRCGVCHSVLFRVDSGSDNRQALNGPKHYVELDDGDRDGQHGALDSANSGYHRPELVSGLVTQGGPIMQEAEGVSFT